MTVEDNIKEGAYNQAVKNVDAIVHTASPVEARPKNANELVIPALQGTVNLLESVLHYGSSSLKRVVLLSSVSAVLEPGQDRVFNEEDWGTSAITWMEEYGGDTDLTAKNGIYGYRASKVFSEKAAWDFYHQHKSTLPWDLTVLNPPFVFGPPIHPLGHSADSLNESMKIWWSVLAPFSSSSSPPSKMSEEALRTQGSAWVDVRELAEAHIRALEKEEAGGERIIVSAGSYVWQEWVDVVKRVGDPTYSNHQDGQDVRYQERYIPRRRSAY